MPFCADTANETCRVSRSGLWLQLSNWRLRCTDLSLKSYKININTEVSLDTSCSKCSHRKRYHQFIIGSNDHRCFYLGCICSGFREDWNQSIRKKISTIKDNFDWKIVRQFQNWQNLKKLNASANDISKVNSKFSLWVTRTTIVNKSLYGIL